MMNTLRFLSLIKSSHENIFAQLKNFAGTNKRNETESQYFSIMSNGPTEGEMGQGKYI